MNSNTNIPVKRTEKLRSTWVDRWRGVTDSNRSSCCILGCPKRDIATCIRVEIQDKRRKDRDCYLPVCKEHSNCDDVMSVKSETKLATYPADPAKEVVKIDSKKKEKEKKETKSKSKSKPSTNSKKRTNSNKKTTKKK